MARAAMRLQVWPGLGKIRVALSARDLGAQVSFGKVSFSFVVGARLKSALPSLRHISQLPLDDLWRQRLVASK
eukprot:4366544-Alexandrium_andersonii.AAC.1